MAKPKRAKTGIRADSRGLLLGALALIFFGGRLERSTIRASQDAERNYRRPISLRDPRLATLKQANSVWSKRRGPKRQVVNVVCLVEDLPGFLQAIELWDDSTFFPILFDDGDFSRTFIRAFAPARVFKIPKAKRAIGDKEAIWKASLAAVGRSWSNGKNSKPPAGDQMPRSLGETPPGVVVSHPESGALAGAIALAAGRFQAMARWETKERFGDVVADDRAELLATELERAIARVAPRHEGWGDDCDFATLAGDYPYRYEAREKKAYQAGIAAFDDLVGRGRNGSRDRWAYTGRLLGDPAASAYRAMCALFLQPRSALCFNGYPEQDPGYVPFNNMSGAAHALDPLARTTVRSGTKQSDLPAWHSIFSPRNRFGLVFITSHGGPSVFNILGDAGRAPDVPATDPTIVFMIHSFSAAEPLNPETVAGRWLDNGAYIYFGSLNEPYLESFRAPTLVADLISEGLPLGAVGRMSREEAGPYEPFARPWRLHYLGDPLYRVSPGDLKIPRVLEIATTKTFPTFAPPARPPSVAADDSTKLAWVERAGLVSPSRRDAPATTPILLSIRREKLLDKEVRRYDGLLVEAALEQSPSKALRAALARIATEETAPKIRRLSETMLLNDFYRSVASDVWTRAVADWEAILPSPTSLDVQSDLIARLSRFADRPARLLDWRKRLRAAIARLDETKQPALVKLLRDESARTERKIRARR